MDTLAQRLRAARGTVTQTRWARLAGVGQGTIARWELGQRQPNIEALAKLCDNAGLCMACVVIGPHHHRWPHNPKP